MIAVQIERRGEMREILWRQKQQELAIDYICEMRKIEESRTIPRL